MRSPRRSPAGERLYELYPIRPVKTAAKIAGVPEPRLHLGGCLATWGT